LISGAVVEFDEQPKGIAIIDKYAFIITDSKINAVLNGEIKETISATQQSAITASSSTVAIGFSVRMSFPMSFTYK
jgi:hypothetical protein